MVKKEIVVLGGGICGLSLVWYLRNSLPEHSIQLFEQSSRVGGVIHHVKQEETIFDQGPKTLRMANSSLVLELIEEVGLKDQLIFSSKEASKRYIYFHKKLHKMPQDPVSFFLSSLTRKAIPSVIKEIFVKKGPAHDETVGAFMRRRFGNYIADTFVEPLITGVCGGDMHKLSVRAYFPNLKKWEEQYGSVMKGAFKTRTKKQAPAGLFTLKGGLSTLTERLGNLLGETIHYNQEVEEIKRRENQIEIYTKQGIFKADHVFLCLPLSSMKKIKLPIDQQQGFFHDVTSTSLVSVSLAYQEDVLRKKGFGYLVPTQEGEKILGVVFDKTTFPSFDDSPYQTKLTVMMGGVHHPEMVHYQDEVLIKTALDSLFDHLGIYQTPQIQAVFRYPEAIPQYPLYHQARLEQLKQLIHRECPMLTLAGSYLTQAAVSGCIAQSKILAEEYRQCLKHSS
jgi:protoporphyrinogen/coproporphyrinogen III oxidase